MDTLSARRRGVGRASDGHGRGAAEEESAPLAVRGWLGVWLRGDWQKRHGSVKSWMVRRARMRSAAQSADMAAAGRTVLTPRFRGGSGVWLADFTPRRRNRPPQQRKIL